MLCNGHRMAAIVELWNVHVFGATDGRILKQECMGAACCRMAVWLA